MLISARIVFIFFDWFFSGKQNQEQNTIEISNEQTNQIQYIYPDNSKNIENNLNISGSDITNIKIEKLKSKDQNKTTIEDIKVLENLYKETKNNNVLDLLVQKFVSDYQFVNAYEHIDQEANPWNQFSDYNLYSYILLNSPTLVITKSDSMTAVQEKIQTFKIEWKITDDDNNFYQWLISLRYSDISLSKQFFFKVTNPKYIGLISKINETISKINSQKDMPSYYQDWLIALTLLKNWYFSIAQKIALNVMLKNDQYILPYQILAYSNFLTNNWDKAIDYFLKLTELDKENTNNYKFLIWVSYYRLWKHEQSVIYLSQIKNSWFETDIYRYMLLNYIKWSDWQKKLELWQKLLWQKDLIKSDFYLFFYNIFFEPFSNWEDFSIYKDNVELSTLWINKCFETIPEADQDVCIYGNVWVDIVNQNWEQAKTKLIYLIKQYNQAYLFHAIWDYYYINKDLEKAKEYYVKAISMTDNIQEAKNLKDKLLSFWENLTGQSF